MGRQDGVIFPLVAVVALLLAFFMTNAALLYEAEQQAAHAVRQAAEADELVQMAVFDVKEQIAATAAVTTKQEGKWTYPRGEAVCRWAKGNGGERPGFLDGSLGGRTAADGRLHRCPSIARYYGMDGAKRVNCSAGRNSSPAYSSGCAIYVS